MSIFSDNLSIIEKYKPDLAVIIKAAVELPDDLQINFGAEEIENRKVLYVVSKEQVWQLDSMYNSETLISDYVKTLSPISSSKIYIFGLGNGMFVKKLLPELDENGRIFVYEPSVKLLEFCLSEFEMQSLLQDARVTIFTPLHESAGIELFKSLGHSVDYSDIAGIRLSHYPNYDRLFTKECEYFNERVEEIITSMESNRNVYERFGEYFAINGLYNVPYIRESRNTYDLGEKFPKNFPAIIVAAGPSLNKNVDLLKQIKGRALIVAADSAVKPLLAHSIIPDVYVSVDANKSPKHYDDPRIKQIPLVGDFSTCRGALEDSTGPYFFARSENPHILTFFKNNNIRIPKLGTGGSVANTAFSFIAELGIKRIIMIGQDLAYTDNKSHADGATRASWGLDLDKNSVMVEGIDGGMVKSSGEFVHYRNWFERSIATCDDIEVINATEGGARIHGAKEMSLREAIDRFCDSEFDIKDAIYSSGYMMNHEQKQLFEEYMKQIPSSLMILSELLKKGIRGYDEMLQMVYERKYQNNQFKKLFEKITQLTEQVENSPALYYAECMVQKEMTNLLKSGNVVKENEREELLDALTEGKKRFELLLEGSKRIQEQL